MYEKYIKRVFDLLLAFIALILLAPIFVSISIIILISDGRPILFKQARPGRGEIIFLMVKFRTMRNTLGEGKELLPDKNRITKLGGLLRKTSLDELPELINILKGEMSFVGPRPLLVEYLPYYYESERKRHAVKPGLTGLAQVSGRNNLEWDDRLKLDMEYVDGIGLKLDVVIFVKTLTQFVSAKDVVVIPSIKGRKLSEIRNENESTRKG